MYFLKFHFIAAVSHYHIISCLVVLHIQIVITHEFWYFSGV